MRKRRSSIYKYMKLENAEHLKNMYTKGVYAGCVDMLNDPFEVEGLSNKNYRIACLSYSKNAKLMWGHYADGHRGCMIRYELPSYYESGADSNGLLRDVKYESRKEYETISSEFEKLYHKDKKWSSEKEIRAVYNPDDYDEDRWCVDEDNEVYLKLKVKAVSFGCMCSVDIYKEALSELKIYNDNQSVKKDKIIVERYKIREGNTYAFIRDNGFDYIREIENLCKPEMCQ